MKGGGGGVSSSLEQEVIRSNFAPVIWNVITSKPPLPVPQHMYQELKIREFSYHYFKARATFHLDNEKYSPQAF